MNLSLIGKLGVILDFIFSSFLSIEMLLISILLFVILVINVNKKNIIVQVVAIGVYLGFVLGIFISYTSYVKTCVDSFVKAFMNYVYFPSTIMYFFIIIFVSIMMLNTLFNAKITKFKKIFNYAFFSIMYFFFLSFLSLCAYDGVDVIIITQLYEDEVILSIVQISNLLLVIWLVYTGFYHLYLYYKKKFDK